MAKASKPLTCTFFVGGKQIEQFTPEQLDKMAERIGEAMSRYYSVHPEEYRVLFKERDSNNKV